MKIQLKNDTQSLEAIKGMLTGIPNGIERASVRAVNRALSAGKVQIVRDVKKTFTVRSGLIRDTIKEQRATLNHPSGELSSKGSRLPLRDFKHTPAAASTTGNKRRAVRVSVKKGQSFTLSRGFKWRGHIFERNEDAPRTRLYRDRQTQKQRLGKPIEKKFDRAVPQLIEEVAIDSVQEKMRAVLNQRLEHEAKFLLKQRGEK